MKREKYEYLHRQLNARQLQGDLRRFAKDGWRLHSIVRSYDYFDVVFERRVKWATDIRSC
jgi:hypothetical protein